jgi:L-erythro-3,5-diaminohexanoate dehydrogenase
VLGAGHAGKLALAAPRDTAATQGAGDAREDAIEVVRSPGRSDIGGRPDRRDPIAALHAVRAAGAPPADLTVVVVNASGCEPTALLLTRDEGTVLLFSMATSFSAAALAADGIGTSARMVVGSGRAPDRGTYALELARRSQPLRRALGLPLDEQRSP